MSVKFKVLSVDANNHSMIVRYFSDLVTEDNLATELNLDGEIVRDPNGSPVRCRTDYNIEITEYPSPSKERLIEIISSYAPKSFFDKYVQVANTQVDTSLSAGISMINEVNLVVDKPKTAIDIDQLLQQLSSNTST